MATALKIYPTFNTIMKTDPSRTTMLRRAFVSEMTKRFRRLKGLIRKAIVERDCFGLSGAQPIVMAVAQKLPNHKQFAFARSGDKVEGFMAWLNDMEEDNILEFAYRPELRRAGAWTDIYIKKAYQKGIIRGRSELQKVKGIEVLPLDKIPGGLNAVFNQPFHADRVGLLYTRCFNELKGIDDALDQAISRDLAQSMAEGRGPRQMARILNKRVDAVGLNRARTLARTETIRAHHSANVQEYRQAGIEGVEVEAEVLTAGFDVCPICAEMESRSRIKPFTLDEIEGMIPAHPSCRCCIRPILKKVKKQKRKAA